MRVDVLTLFPDAFSGPLSNGILRIAREKGLLDVRLRNFRDFTKDRYKSVDDKPYGGGPGMVLLCEPIFDCQAAAVEEGHKEGLEGEPFRVALTPQGRRLDQELLEKLAKERWLQILCGHYEGFDERILQGLKPLEVSIGDYVLSGGEVPAMVLLDGIARLRPGALGAPDGAVQDSFSGGTRLLEAPQYTRPRTFRGMDVPDVLLSGDHGAIKKWRDEQALARTRARRPDLLPGTKHDTKTPE
ncbi:MAG: tRNA (guanosine(37)-N1)-methyltransferase TrmD [Planctomycetota bacterium]